MKPIMIVNRDIDQKKKRRKGRHNQRRMESLDARSRESSRRGDPIGGARMGTRGWLCQAHVGHYSAHLVGIRLRNNLETVRPVTLRQGQLCPCISRPSLLRSPSFDVGSRLGSGQRSSACLTACFRLTALADSHVNAPSKLLVTLCPVM